MALFKCQVCEQVFVSVKGKTGSEIINQLKSRGWEIRETEEGWTWACPLCQKELDREESK